MRRGLITALVVVVALIASSCSASERAAENLTLVLSNPTRNTSADDNTFRGVPMDEIALADLTINADVYDETLVDSSTSGFFRVKCEVSHFAYDDPIVHPDEPGRAHLHMFFGNTEAHAFSTFDTLLNSGTSTCNGQDLNRSAYWVPAMLDRQGNALIPTEIMVYYKNDNFRENSNNELVVAFPDNLRMVAGSADSTRPQDALTGPAESLPIVSFTCGPAYERDNDYEPVIPECSGLGHGPFGPQGRALEMRIAFPQCLAAADDAYRPDQSHTSYSVGGYYGSVCPDSHPVDISSVMYRIFYSPDEYGGQLVDLHLSSDVTPTQILPGGTTSHGDWFGAWHPEAMDLWIENCNNQTTDCEVGLLARTPPISLVPREPSLYEPGHLVPPEQLTLLCPDRELDQSDPLRSVALCQHS